MLRLNSKFKTHNSKLLSGWLTRPGFTTNSVPKGRSDEGGLGLEETLWVCAVSEN
ncbi:MAG: hypothetical protein QOJ64_3082 [Acidobacteriota bacterium]|jgi:hypothetical protein|nr:hypothetical protein [Acidobacteriota bacterium]